MLVAPWVENLRIVLPHTGTAALVYYNGLSNPTLAKEISESLAPGATFIDVGAHVGEYTLLAGRIVGSTGRVYALEPNIELTETVLRNVRLNDLEGVTVEPVAASGQSGTLGFGYDERSLGGWIVSEQAARYEVRAVTLDSFAAQHELDAVDLLKLDTAGAEAEAITGAARLLSERRVRKIAAKLYDAATVRERFGGDNLELVRTLLGAGYLLEIVTQSTRIPISSEAEAASLASDYSTLLVARPPAG
jgi:FkbM family methyltransferase